MEELTNLSNDVLHMGFHSSWGTASISQQELLNFESPESKVDYLTEISEEIC
jgi:hypothetical protein